MLEYKNKHIQVSLPSTGVLVLQINRPPINALNDELWEEIGSLCQTAGEDPDVKVVVLASLNDKIWSAGLDLIDTKLPKVLGNGDPARDALVFRQHILHLQSCVTAIESSLKPVIAAIHGLTIGGAIDIVAACDVRYTADNARFSIKEVDVGLAADVGSLQRLPSICGNGSLLRELAFTGRDFNSKEALELGLVSKVVSGGREGVLEEALKLAKIIAAKSPIAVVGTKNVLNYSRDHTVDEGLNYVTTWNMSMLQASDLQESMKAVMTKKKPAYKPLPKL